MFPWTKVIDAHKEMEANKNSGKVSRESLQIQVVEEVLMTVQDRL